MTSQAQGFSKERIVEEQINNIQNKIKQMEIDFNAKLDLFQKSIKVLTEHLSRIEDKKSRSIFRPFRKKSDLRLKIQDIENQQNRKSFTLND